MSRYGITLLPGGAIPRDLDVGVTLNPEPPAAEPATVFTPAPGFCVPNPGAPRFWDGEAWSQTERTELSQFGGNAIFLKLQGELCNQPVEWVIHSDDGWALSDMMLVDGGFIAFNAGSRAPTTITWEAFFAGKSCGLVTLHIVAG